MDTTRPRPLDAKSEYQTVLSEMVGKAASWLRQMIEYAGEVPSLPNGQVGLEVGYGCSPSLGRICRKVLRPDGKLTWLTLDYEYHRDVEPEIYVSESTFHEVERAIKKLAESRGEQFQACRPAPTRSRRMSTDQLRLADPRAVCEKIQEFIRGMSNELRRNGAVIGLSGGLDSTIVAYLEVLG
jgi:hypothetical protein